MANTHNLLEGSRRYQRAGAKIRGRADPHEWCEITVKLRGKEELPEPDAATGAPVVSHDDFAARFGANDSDMAEIEQELGKYGLILIMKQPASRRMKFAGSVEAMEQAFKTHLFSAVLDGHSYRARSGDLHVPAALAGKVTGVFGLDSRRMVHPRRHGLAAIRPGQAAQPVRPWFTPQELAQYYDFPDNDGAGQTVAILEFGGEYVASDMQQFAKATQMATIPDIQTMDVDSSSMKGDPGYTGEVMLDIEVVAAAAPGANQIVYFSDFTEQGWIDVLDTALHDAERKADIISISYGYPEGMDVWTGQAITAINDTLKAAAALGVTVCVSSGDDGSQAMNDDGRAHVSFPTSSPYVLSVGGTMLPRRNGTIHEVAWKEGDGLRVDGGGSTGGGVSLFLPRPAWQKVKIASVNPGALDGRVVPDISANAAGKTGYFVVVGGTAQVSGGTSASAPLWAALVARINTERRAAGKAAVGWLTPLLYQANAQTAGKPLGAAACADVIEGDNITAAAGGYRAAIGFDAVTGWGSPKGKTLARLLI